jgi:hypothetical protein
MKCECSQPLELHTMLYMHGECNVNYELLLTMAFFPLFFSFFQFCDSAEVAIMHKTTKPDLAIIWMF